MWHYLKLHVRCHLCYVHYSNLSKECVLLTIEGAPPTDLEICMAGGEMRISWNVSIPTEYMYM